MDSQQQGETIQAISIAMELIASQTRRHTRDWSWARTASTQQMFNVYNKYYAEGRPMSISCTPCIGKVASYFVSREKDFKKDPETCAHEVFSSNVKVGRLTDEEGGKVTGFCADVTIKCMQCDKPFAFIGVPGGYSPFEPKTNADSTQLRVPIAPATGEIIFEAKPHKDN